MAGCAVGSSRTVRLLKGAGMKLVFSTGFDPPCFVFKESGSIASSNDLEIVVEGRSAGQGYIEARDADTMQPKAHLDIAVLPQRSMKVAYYILGYTHGKEPKDQPKLPTEAEVRDIHTKVRQILLDQANVSYEFVEVANLEPYYTSNIGFTVGNVTTEERIKLSRVGNATLASHLVYFVGGIRTDSPREKSPNGQTFGQFSLIKERPPGEFPYHLTVAHELGHFLSGALLPKHDDGATENLMHDGAPHGSFLPKNRIMMWYPDL
jgi:hypothetical protein